MDSVSLPPSVPSLPLDVVSDALPDIVLPDAISSSGDSDLLVGPCDIDLSVDLPVAMDMEDELPNAFDEAVETDSDLDLVLEQVTDTRGVPGPLVAAELSGQQHVAEYYSPPRVLPVARGKGLAGCLSLDLLSGWDFKDSRLRELSVVLLTQLCIIFLVLSPPCTIFSELQRLWNFKRMTRDAVAAKWEEGMTYLRHAMACARAQVMAGRFFAFEHPARASSWRQDCVQQVLRMPGVVVCTFDQCMLGLRSKVSGVPMRKRTKIMTNSAALAGLLAGKMCTRCHQHQTIQGSAKRKQLARPSMQCDTRRVACVSDRSAMDYAWFSLDGKQPTSWPFCLDQLACSSSCFLPISSGLKAACGGRRGRRFTHHPWWNC